MWENSKGLKSQADEINTTDKSMYRESRFVVANLIWREWGETAK